VFLDQVGGSEDEYLAHQVGVLLVAAHEADHDAPGRVFDHLGEPVPHDLLELHALLDDRLAAPAIQERLLDAREAATQDANHEIVLVVGLRTGRATPIELLEQRDYPVGDRAQHIPMVTRLALGNALSIHLEDLSLGDAEDGATLGADRSSGSRPSAPRADPTGGRERQAAMPAPEPPLDGDELLEAVTEAMVELHRRYYHSKPVTAKTRMLGEDLLACVLGGVYTDVEKTMIELERSPTVRDTRNTFQNAMQQKFIDKVERLSGRNVTAFISDSHIGPDIEIELFMLTPTPS
jgi:uncharacterized protein YbcI